MHNPGRRPSLALGLEDPNKVKAMRKMKIAQLNQEQIQQQAQQPQQPEHQAEQQAEQPQKAASPRVQFEDKGGNLPGPAIKDEDEQKEQEPDHPQVNFNVFPYYHDVVKCQTLLRSPNQKDQLKGALEIGEVAWNGGEMTQTFIGKCGILKTLATLLDNAPDNSVMKLRIIQSLGVVCRGNLEIQDQLVELNFVQRLYNVICDSSQEMRRWTTNTFFYLLHDCPNAQSAALKISDLKAQLNAAITIDWSNWDYNDAKEILKMLRLRSADDD